MKKIVSSADVDGICLSNVCYCPGGGGGGRGNPRYFWLGCAARSPNPVPIFGQTMKFSGTL